MINMQNSFLKTFNCKLSIFFLLLFDVKFYKKCFKTVQFVQGSFNAAFFFLAANAAFFLAVNFKIRSQILLKVGWTNNWHFKLNCITESWNAVNTNSWKFAVALKYLSCFS